MLLECRCRSLTRAKSGEVQHDGLARGEEEADSDRWLSKHSGAMISRVAQWLVVNGLEHERIQEHMLCLELSISSSKSAIQGEKQT